MPGSRRVTILFHVPMSHAALLPRRHPLQIPPPQFRGSCQCVGSLVSYKVLSVICTRARAPSGDDDRDSFEIHLRLQCATAPDADPVTRDPDPEKNKRARVNNVIVS